MHPVEDLLIVEEGPSPKFPPSTYNRWQRRGISFEKKVGRHLAPLCPLHGPWLYFTDKWGPRVVQPDFVLPHHPTTNHTYLLECKLSYKDEAEKKLLTIYRPLVERLYGVPVCCIQVVRHLRHYDGPLTTFEEAFAATTPYMVVQYV